MNEKKRIPLLRDRFRFDPSAKISRHESSREELILREKFKEDIEIFTEKIECLQCGETFSRSDNLICRMCKMHPGKLVEVGPNYHEWNCCRLPSPILGCVSVMHISNPIVLRQVHQRKGQLYITVPKELIDSNIIPHSKELIDGYPTPTAYPASCLDPNNPLQLYYHFEIICTFN